MRTFSSDVIADEDIPAGSPVIYTIDGELNFRVKRPIQNKQLVINEKWCNRCNRHKDINEFYKDRSTKYGRSFYCKACVRKYNNTPKKKESLRIYYQNRKKLYRQRYKEDGEKIRAYQREWYQKNKEKVRQYHRNYMERKKCI